MIRALLVDDQPQVLEGLEMLLALEADLEIVGTAQTAEAAITLACALRPDIIVMDVRLPGIDGVAATRVLGKEFPDGKVVILTLYCDSETRRRAQNMTPTAKLTVMSFQMTSMAGEPWAMMPRATGLPSNIPKFNR